MSGSNTNRFAILDQEEVIANETRDNADSSIEEEFFQDCDELAINTVNENQPAAAAGNQDNANNLPPQPSPTPPQPSPPPPPIAERQDPPAIFEMAASMNNFPEFDGKADAKTSWTQWIDGIDSLFGINTALSDEQKAFFAKSHLTGIAYQFVKNLKDNPDKTTLTNKWSTLRPELIERFEPIEKKQIKSSTFADCNQRKEETVRDYYDRLEGVRNDMDRLLSQPTRASAQYKEIRELQLRTQFRNGCRKEIHDYLNAKFDENTKLDELKEAALAFEAVACENKKKKNEGVDAIQKDNGRSDVDAETAAIGSQNRSLRGAGTRFSNMRIRGRGRAARGNGNPSPFRGGGRGGAANRGGGPGNQFSRQAGVHGEVKPDGSFLCYNCFEWGHHWRSNCPNPRKSPPQGFVFPRRQQPPGMQPIYQDQNAYGYNYYQPPQQQYQQHWQGYQQQPIQQQQQNVQPMQQPPMESNQGPSNARVLQGQQQIIGMLNSMGLTYEEEESPLNSNAGPN